MPGPMSSPNGDRSIVTNGEHRQQLRDKGKLYTGKTEKMAARGPRIKRIVEVPTPKGKKR